MASSNKVVEAVGNLNVSFKKLTVEQQAKPKVKASKAKKPKNPKVNMKSSIMVINSDRARRNGLRNSATGNNYFKTYSIFRCTKVECKRHTNSWKSAHGWLGREEEPEKCEYCNRNAKLVKKMDEPNCELDMYVCGCGNRWDCLHDPFIDEVACYTCEKVVKRSGTQKRYACHFWFECNDCETEWETAKPGRVFSQRCQNCQSPGEKIGAYTETQEERDHRVASEGGRTFFRVGTGTHDVDGCESVA